MEKQDLRNFFTALDTAIQAIDKKADKNEEAGIIRSVKDGILHINGLLGLRMGEVIFVEGVGVKALVMQLDGRNAYAVLLDNSTEVKEGQAVKTTGEFLGLNVSEDYLGRVVNSLGIAIDGGKELRGGIFMPMEKIAPGVMTREPVSQPVQTGIVAIDSMIPVGRGQRELIIGDRQTGKTTVAIDTIINQKSENMICVYVAIGQREANTASVVETLREAGALDYTVIVNAGASGSAVSQYLAPYAGSAIGEYFMAKGQDVLIVFDDLSKHAVAYRELSLLLRRPPGREAYPGDVFYLHSRLLERAARLNKENGGGSMTALPIVETQAGDVSAYIPTNVISITDGQIFLESSLFASGIKPAINIGISVSRVGGAAQTKIMKKVSGTAKLDLAQYYELAAFSQFSSDLDEETKKQLIRGERVVEAMKQKENSPYSLWQEIVVLRAATNGYLDNIEAAKVQSVLQALLQHIGANETDLVKAMTEKKELTDEIKQQLDEALVKGVEIVK
jgi:F-type H+-transporting ATPase subunit alpha